MRNFNNCKQSFSLSNLPLDFSSIFDKVGVTTHVVRLKLFRLKAEEVRRARLPHFGGETADCRAKHGFQMLRISAFPNPAFRGTYSLPT